MVRHAWSEVNQRLRRATFCDITIAMQTDTEPAIHLYGGERVVPGVEQEHGPKGLSGHAPTLAGAALFLVAGALYVYTLAPTVLPGDYAEFQMCAAILGIPHPTGYPLYILLGKVFTLLPVGDVAY